MLLHSANVQLRASVTWHAFASIAGDKVMVRIVHNLTLRPLNIARHLIPAVVWRVINFPLVISATLNVDHVSSRVWGWD